MIPQMLPLIALFNHDDGIIALLEHALVDAGYRVVPFTIEKPNSVPVAEDLIAFLEANRPQVAVYDIEPPYQNSWDLFEAVRLATSWCPFVLTTTDLNPESQLIQPPVETILVQKPYGLRNLLDAVKLALEAGEAAATQ